MPFRRPAPARARCAVLALLPLAVPACGSTPDPTPAGPRPELVQPSMPSVASGIRTTDVPRLVNVLLDDGRPRGVSRVVEVERHAPVRLTVVSDVSDVVLVEGYQARVRLAIDEPVQLSFIVSRAGDFDVRLERAGTVLTTLRVR